ncbi:hypothetical protein L249_8809 [Ophiocordyceps polyrhachis-furcata BCC 54312]|uniref:Uncharacterized protein n=1 Tax=Ophiocordyceps polyrhachis-furcata BCC 54312 TaxID=1330021 RepID=A0A367L1K6_9HYPO|nr:hypothetical protein L249_8809 [Ophiocordyceps polyrhachis-furcata BCC 54312]
MCLFLFDSCNLNKEVLSKKMNIAGKIHSGLCLTGLFFEFRDVALLHPSCTPLRIHTSRPRTFVAAVSDVGRMLTYYRLHCQTADQLYFALAPSFPSSKSNGPCLPFQLDLLYVYVVHVHACMYVQEICCVVSVFALYEV